MNARHADSDGSDGSSQGAATIERPVAALGVVAHGGRLGSVTGDMRCAQCAFNLRGQPIIRETHYNMVAILCPECGTPAPLLEYPRLGPWARRLGTLAMVAVLAGLVFLFVVMGGILAGVTSQATKVAAAPLAESIAQAFVDYAKEQQQAAALAAPAGTPAVAPGNFTYQYATQYPVSPDTWVDGVWWNQHQLDNWRRRVPIWTDPFGVQVMTVWAQGAVPLLAGAVLIACAMPHRRGTRLLIIPLTTLIIATAMLAYAHVTISGTSVAYLPYYNASGCATTMLPWWVKGVQLAILLTPVLIGAYLGRPLARGLVRWLVPPRQYVAFGFLWAADGLPMPKG